MLTLILDDDVNCRGTCQEDIAWSLSPFGAISLLEHWWSGWLLMRFRLYLGRV